MSAIIYRRALTVRDRCKALYLVYRKYREQNYIRFNPVALYWFCRPFFSKYTATFVGVYEKTIVASVTVINDSPHGLPCDELYHDELQVLRTSGSKCAEVSRLASDSTRVGAFKALLPLFQTVFEYAQSVHITDLVITVNPKHDAFYSSLGFVTVGSPKSYGAVNNAPAIAKVLHLGSKVDLLVVH